jgi:hypothetical protein
MGFETTISAGEQPQTYALDRAATGIGTNPTYMFHKFHEPYKHACKQFISGGRTQI